MGKDLDIVVFGATGYTGKLVVEHLARAAAGGGVRWGIAGRDEAKLRALAVDVPVIVADAKDEASLRRMAERTRVLVACAGPFAWVGEPVVQACVDAGTDYVDITGEPDFVAQLIARLDDRALEKGVRVVPCCGFDSVPADLGVFHAMRELGPVARARVESFAQINWDVSGGTWQSMVAGMGRGRGTRAVELPLRRSGPRRLRAARATPRFEPDASGWLIPSPTIDPQIVLRSASMLDGYGADFEYGYYFRVASLPRMAALGLGLGTLYALAQSKATRGVLSRLRPSGSGFDEEAQSRGYFRVTTVARAAGQRIVTRVSGGDKYVETATMVGQAALSLVLDRDRLPQRAGVLTPSTAFGDILLRRLEDNGVRFEVVKRTREERA